MKKIVTILLSSMVVFSLVGCNSVPSEEKIKAALEDGTITVEDAKSKGWINDSWIKENFEQIEAKSKIYLFDPFETTYLDGTPASSTLIEGKMCLVFFNTQEEETMDKLKAYDDAYDDMMALGIPTIGIITDKNVDGANEEISAMKFPIIVYNEEMKTSLKDYSEMLDKDVVSVFTKEGGFYSAWYTKGEKEDLLSFGEALANEE